MDQKKLIDILNSVMFPQPGSVSVFNSFHSLVFFFPFIQVDLYNSFGSWTLRARVCPILPFKRQDNAIYYRWSGWASGNCKVSESHQVPGCVRHHLFSYTEVLPAFFSLCALVEEYWWPNTGENLAMNGQATRTLLLKEDTVKLYVQTKSSKMLEVLGSGFSLKGLTK